MLSSLQTYKLRQDLQYLHALPSSLIPPKLLRLMKNFFTPVYKVEWSDVIKSTVLAVALLFVKVTLTVNSSPL